jgi:hypothetical protein
MHRMYAIVEISLEMQELRMQKKLKVARQAAKDGTVPDGVSEDDLAKLADTLKTIEQTTELDIDLHRSADGGARSSSTSGTGQSGAATSEADALRRDIAERLGKLVPPS